MISFARATCFLFLLIACDAFDAASVDFGGFSHGNGILLSIFCYYNFSIFSILILVYLSDDAGIVLISDRNLYFLYFFLIG